MSKVDWTTHQSWCGTGRMAEPSPNSGWRPRQKSGAARCWVKWHQTNFGWMHARKSGVQGSLEASLLSSSGWSLCQKSDSSAGLASCSAPSSCWTSHRRSDFGEWARSNRVSLGWTSGQRSGCRDFLAALAVQHLGVRVGVWVCNP